MFLHLMQGMCGVCMRMALGRQAELEFCRWYACCMATGPQDSADDEAPLNPEIVPISAENSDFVVTAKPEEPDQALLFSSAELQVPDRPARKYDELQIPAGGIAQYRKGIAALHSVPINGEHTLNSRRVMDAIVALVQLHYKRMPKQQREMLRELEASPMFRVTKGELRTMAGIASKSFNRVEEVLERLHDMKINWNVLGEGAEVQWEMKSRFLASWGRGVGVYEGQVCFSIDPRLQELILEPRLWVKLNLDVQKQLRTETSYALYQNAWRYIGTANKVTADFPVETWIELLTGPSRYVQTLPNGEKIAVDYSEWKSRFLKPAMAAINDVPALADALELVEKKSGLRVRRLQFKFVRKRQGKLDLPMTWPDPIVDALKSLGFLDDELADLAQGFSLDDVVDALGRFREAEKRKKANMQRISAPKAFFQGILAKVTMQASLDDEELAAIEKKAKAEEALARAKASQERASLEFSSFQTKRLAAAMEAISPEHKQTLLDAFEKSADFAKARLLVTKGWDHAGVGAWAIFKNWLLTARPDDFFELLPAPEERALEAWLLWRLENPEG